MALFAMFGITTPVASQSQSADTSKPKDSKPEELVTVTFRHEECERTGPECRLAYSLTLKEGQSFIVAIRRTPLADFTYTVAGVLAQRPSEGRTERLQLGDTSFVVTHDAQYGGYIVLVRKKPEVTSTEFAEATLLISVNTSRWIAEFAGGFPVLTLRDRRFFLRDTLVGGESRFEVVRDKGSEDDFSLATASFIHVSNTKFPYLALSFGLGIGGETAYFVGPSVRFGDVSAFTAGFAFGARDDYPTGLEPGGLTADANALTNLRKRNQVGFFIALSFSFLGSSRTELEKPFKGGAPSGATPAPPPAAVEIPDTSSLTYTPAQPQPGATVTFVVTLAPEGGTTLAAGEYAITLEGPFEGPPSDVQMSAVEGSRTLQGSFSVTLRADASGTVTPTVTLDHEGQTFSITGSSFEIRPPQPGGREPL